MGQVSRCLRRTTDGYTFWCPGCLEMHQVWTDRAERPCWTFDGNVEKPTFTPSILITGKQGVNDERGNWTGEWVTGPDGKALDHVCHSFVTAGRMIFLGDCTHHLKGQTVALPDLPAWAADNREEPAMSDTENAPLPADLPETAVAAQEPVGAVDAAADAPEGAEPAAAPLETDQDTILDADKAEETTEQAEIAPAAEPEPLQTHEFTKAQLDAQAADVAEQSGEQAGSKTVETLTLRLDAEDYAKLAADLGAQITAGFAAAEQQIEEKASALRREMQDELNEFAGHFEKKLESIAQGLDGLDPEKLAELLAALKGSGVAELKARLDKLDLQLRHIL